MFIKNMRGDKKGISPVIATVMLIGIVIVIGLIIFMWFRGMTEEAVTKFDGQNIQLVCEDVDFDASYSEGMLYIENLGNVPIWDMQVQKVSAGSYETVSIKEKHPNEWPVTGLNQGGATGHSVSDAGSYEKFVLIPVLIGKNKEGVKKTSVCEERHGMEVYTNL